MGRVIFFAMIIGFAAFVFCLHQNAQEQNRVALAHLNANPVQLPEGIPAPPPPPPPLAARPDGLVVDKAGIPRDSDGVSPPVGPGFFYHNPWIFWLLVSGFVFSVSNAFIVKVFTFGADGSYRGYSRAIIPMNPVASVSSIFITILVTCWICSVFPSGGAAALGGLLDTLIHAIHKTM